MGILRSVMVTVVLVAGCRRAALEATSASGDLVRRVTPRLNMPTTRDGGPPKLLSQVGAFQDLAKLTPAAGLMPYDINVPFWSDGAAKRRWIGLPAGGKIRFSKEGEWKFPAGTVFVKNFAPPQYHNGRGNLPAVIETRVLVCEGDGNVSGASYRWRPDGSDAELVTESITMPLTNRGAPGRSWHFPGLADCRVCHTQTAGGVLGVTTRQLNRALGEGGENQLMTWDRLGFFEPKLGKLDPKHLAKLSAANDSSANIEERARSFLDVNCANCHRPGGVAGHFDARYDTPRAYQSLIDGPVLIDLGIDRARVVLPHDPWRSIALVRVETSDLTRMPPLAHQTVDRDGARVLRTWIESLPGAEVLEPPTIEPKGGAYRGTLHVVLRHRDHGAAIHYTLDGSSPGKSSTVYEGPIDLTEPTTLRARAFKEGATRSIIVQDTFIVND